MSVHKLIAFKNSCFGSSLLWIRRGGGSFNPGEHFLEILELQEKHEACMKGRKYSDEAYTRSGCQIVAKQDGKTFAGQVRRLVCSIEHYLKQEICLVSLWNAKESHGFGMRYWGLSLHQPLEIFDHNIGRTERFSDSQEFSEALADRYEQIKANMSGDLPKFELAWFL